MKVTCPNCGTLPIDLKAFPDMPELIKEVQRQFDEKGGAQCKTCGAQCKVEAGQ